MKEKGMGEGGGTGDLCSFLFGDFEKEPLFPKPKQPFPCKRGNEAMLCASFVELIVLQEGLFSFY